MQGHPVLVLDVDEAAREATARLLERHGFQVKAAGSADMGLLLMEAERFSCAVVDVELEGMDGLDAIPILRARVPGLPIIVTAARNTREQEARVRQRDIVYYHVKGFDRDELARAVARAATGAYRHRRGCILVVDDDRDYQAAMRLTLETADYEVLSAYSKEEGLACLRDASPDLVILDIMMKSISDGFHLLYEAKADPQMTLPPVLSISCISKETGYRFSPTTDEEYFPADDFMDKPVNPAELLRRVEALLAGRDRPRAE